MRKLTLIILLFISQYSYSQWFQLPNLPVNGTVRQMTFANANTGWIVVEGPTKTIKTTDGGMSWNIVVNNGSVLLINFLNENTGYAIDSSGRNFSKTTNGGLNWNVVSTTANIYMNLCFANQDTGWVCGTDGNFGKVWKTTNGGINFNLVFTSNIGNLNKLFFLKDKLNGEYVGWANYQTYFARTTNSGTNWIPISNNLNSMGGGVNDFYFQDTTTGVIARNTSRINKTINGGYNWSSIFEPNTGYSLTMGNKNIGWISLYADTVIKTSDFFQTYGKQKFPANGAGKLFAVDTSIVYAVGASNSFFKTTNGGGEIIVSVQNQSETVSGYYLSQNFPNPFNPNTNISFKLQDPSYITLKVYNVKGEEVRTLVNEKRNGGNYSVQFDGSNLPSGVYFYKLETENFSETKKMVLLK